MKAIAPAFKISLKIGKTLLLMSLLLLQGYFCMAQDDDDKEGDDIKAVRVAFMTDKLKLSSDEAQKFWPVYNNYLQEVRKARRDNAGDVLKQQEAIVNVRKKYKDSFKRALNSDDRANRVFSSEQELKTMIRNEWQKRHPNGGGNRHLLQQMGGAKRNQ